MKYQNILSMSNEQKNVLKDCFSKAVENDNMQVNELYHNDWLSLKEVVAPEEDIQGYVFSHETRCNGKIVVVLPFRKNGDNFEYGLRKEVTPSWSLDPEISALTGGFENDIEDTAIMELEEEAGFKAEKRELIDLGESYASKSSDTVYSLFAVDVTGKEEGEALGDGTKQDAEGTIEWVRKPDSKDPQVSIAYLRLLRHLGEDV